MTGLSIECTGAQTVRVDRYQNQGSDTVYLDSGQSASLAQDYLAQVRAAESGTPALRLVNGSKSDLIDVYSVSDGRTERARPVMPGRSRAVTLDEGETLLLIPVPSSETPQKRTEP